jgi:hypothetical protein
MSKKVYIVNNSSHDFSTTKDFGESVFLSEGPMNRYATNNMFRHFEKVMEDSSSEDYIVPCALSIMNVIATCIFARKHGKLNLLLFKDGKYIERNHVFK